MSKVDTSYWRDHPNVVKSEGLWPGYHCNKDKELRRDFGITCGDYYRMYDKQKGKCRLCHKKSAKSLAVDHDPDTGLFCGLLCTPCNREMSYEKRQYVKHPPGEEFQIYVKSNKVAARDKRLHEKRTAMAAARASNKAPQAPPAFDHSASALEKLRRAHESSGS